MCKPEKENETAGKAAARFVRYRAGAERYGLGVTKFQELAKKANAVYKVDKVVLVNCELFERYLEAFRLK